MAILWDPSRRPPTPTMKLLFLSKRRPQQRDLLDRPYGRFHYLPAELAARGHSVTSLLVSHNNLPSEERELGGVRWLSHDLQRLGPLALLRALEDAARHIDPDVVVGCSDTWAGWLAHRLAHRMRTSLVIDAYDNYEAYMPWNLPLHWLWRRAVAGADLVSAAGPQLAERLAQSRLGKSRPHVLPMAADPAFRPMDRLAARHALGLPTDAPLLGYYGGWAANRGTSMVTEMFRQVRSALPSARLVLSGRPPEAVCREPGVIPLGYIDDAQLPLLVNAMDVACVVTSDSSFGRYSYPAKLCEAMACGVPVVATATGPVRWMLGEDPRFLVPVDDPATFAQRVVENIRLGRTDYGPNVGWPAIAATFDTLLTGLSRTDRN